jgi:hypothetical protein
LGDSVTHSAISGFSLCGFLWISPLEPRAHSAAWVPDGSSIAYAAGNVVYLTSEKVSASRELGRFAATPTELLWSKDGERLRFILDDVEAI